MKRQLKNLQFLLFLFFGIFNSSAQEKYAVIITGDYAFDGPPLEQYNNGENKSPEGYYNEFWYDTYLMWEMLVFEKGFTDENVFVFFANGLDYTKLDLVLIYKAINHEGYTKITDYAATKGNVRTLFGGFVNGIGPNQEPCPIIAPDDFLFIWVFDHGGGGGQAYINLMGIEYEDWEFEEDMESIQANKIVFQMGQCSSGGFADNLLNSNYFFYSSCQPGEQGHKADNLDLLGNNVTEKETWNVNGNDEMYDHSEFNFHTYSSLNGESPIYVNNYNGELYSDADLNNDSFISVLEASIWEDNHESIQDEDPVISDIGQIGAFTSLEYPTLLHANITTDETFRGIIGISKDVHVSGDALLTLKANAKVDLLNNAKLFIEPGATLIIEDGVDFRGDINNSIIINGDIQIGQNVTFNRLNNSGYFEGLVLNNNSLQKTLNNLSFTSTYFHNYGIGLNIVGSIFNNCPVIYSHLGDVTISGSTFTDTWLYIENQWSNFSFTVDVSNCTFTNNIYNIIVGIDIWNYDMYNISSNTINGFYNGIQLINSGNGPYENQEIKNNYIYNCLLSGIHAYNSYGTFQNNHIHDNGYGIRLLNNCNINLVGNPNAVGAFATQEIKDNTEIEVYSSTNSFPPYFAYNVLKDEDNLGNPIDPLLCWNPPLEESRDIRNNCWGLNFDPLEDLFPVENYSYSPTWCPGTPPPPPDPDPSEAIYNNAEEAFTVGDYSEAKTFYEEVIQEYPESKYAHSSMRALIRLEQYAGNNYEQLKTYYLTNDTIINDSALALLGEWLSNRCDVELGNWPDAISWYENVILNPATLEDSVFAIVDLGYIYFLMQNSGVKSEHIGALSQYKPETQTEFFGYRDFLLSLLPGESIPISVRQSIERLSPGELIQNVPNPFSGTTDIWFRMDKDAYVIIEILDYTGKILRTIDCGHSKNGIDKIQINSYGLKPGMYFYSLIVDGTRADTKKMTIY